MQKKSLFFGRFPQGEKGELQPIEWFVLKEENENKLLISKYALLCRAFHKGYAFMQFIPTLHQRYAGFAQRGLSIVYG